MIDPTSEKRTQSDRSVVFHLDDIGMCQSSVSAFETIHRSSRPVSASVMAPCPWLPEAAERLSGADLGVHLTLISEWPGYRWRPISNPSPDSGLVDSAGYLPSNLLDLVERADADAVERELAAQLLAVKALGVDVTHLDCHLFAALYDRFVDSYRELAVRHELPALLGGAEVGSSLETLRFGAPLFAGIAMMPLTEHAGRFERAATLLDDFPPGLSCMIFHPANETPELRTICDDWRARVADFELLSSAEWWHHVEACGVRPVRYVDIRKRMRESLYGSPLSQLRVDSDELESATGRSGT